MAEEQVRLSRAAPTIPPSHKIEKPLEGKQFPISSPTIPSIYNKKLNNLFSGRLVVLYGKNTVDDALRRLARYNISSMPVIKSKSDQYILGFVDVLDLLRKLCDLLELGKGQTNIDAEALRSKINQFKKIPLSECVNLSQRNPFKAIDGNAPLSEAVSQYLSGAHRIAILDENGELIGVISQWTIVNYIATVPTDDKEWIPALREPLSQSHYSPDVITVKDTDLTLDCFQKMHSECLYAVAVVDDSGKLVGSLSASDLKSYHMFASDFQDLLQPVGKFLASIRKKQDRPENFVIAVPPSTRVMDLVIRLNEEIAHRAYIVDENFHPIGIFTLTDLMKGLVVDTHTIATFAKTTAIAD